MAPLILPDSFFDREAIAGPFLIGFAFNTLLSGVVLAMAARYFRSYGATDWRGHRAFVVLVALLVGCCLTNFSGNIVLFWHLLVWQQPLGEFLQITPEFLVVDIMTCWSIGLSQLFFVGRLWTVARSRFLLLFCGSIATLELVSPIVFAILRNNLAPIAGITTLPGLDRLNRYGQTLFFCTFGNDVILASSLIYCFHRQRRGFNAETDNLLTRLARLTLSTALLTVPLMAVTCFSYFAMPHQTNTIPLSFECLLLPTFDICALYTLTSRNAIRDAAASSSRGRPVFAMPSFLTSRLGSSAKEARSTTTTDATATKTYADGAHVATATVQSIDEEKTRVPFAPHSTVAEGYELDVHGSAV